MNQNNIGVSLCQLSLNNAGQLFLSCPESQMSSGGSRKQIYLVFGRLIKKTLKAVSLSKVEKYYIRSPFALWQRKTAVLSCQTLDFGVS